MSNTGMAATEAEEAVTIYGLDLAKMLEPRPDPVVAPQPTGAAQDTILWFRHQLDNADLDYVTVSFRIYDASTRFIFFVVRPDRNYLGCQVAVDCWQGSDGSGIEFSMWSYRGDKKLAGMDPRLSDNYETWESAELIRIRDFMVKLAAKLKDKVLT